MICQMSRRIENKLEAVASELEDFQRLLWQEEMVSLKLEYANKIDIYILKNNHLYNSTYNFRA